MSVLPHAGAQTTESYNWQKAKIGPLGFIDGMVIHPLAPYTKYVRTDVGGAYRWNPGTQTWIPITDKLIRNDNSCAGIESIAIDPSNANVVYIAAKDIYKSTDQGSTWTPLNLRKPDNSLLYMGPNDDWRQAGERLVVDPNNGGQVIYFGSRKEGLWRSTNGGSNWQQVTSFPTVGTVGAGISFVAFVKSSGTATTASQKIYVGVIGAGVYYSSNGGADWTIVSGGPATSYNPLRSAVDSNGVLYVTYNSGTYWTNANGAIYKFTDGVGTNVTPTNPAGYAWSGITVDPSNPNRVLASTWHFANTQNEVIWTSTDAGSSWNTSPATFTQPSWYVDWTPQNWSATVLIDPENTSRTWKTDGFAVFATDNNMAGSQSWSTRSNGVEELIPQHLRKLPQSGALLYSCGDMIGFTLTDLANYPTTKWLPGTYGFGTSVDFCATNPAFVVRTVSNRNWFNNSGYSTDGGQTWTNFPSQISQYGAIAVSATNTSQMVWASNGAYQPVYYTTDRGTSWNRVKGPDGTVNTAPTANWFSSEYENNVPLASDRINGNKFYLYTIDGSAFWRSTDGGVNWTKVSESVLPWRWEEVLKAAPDKEDEVWISFPGDSLWRSPDGGSNWTKIANLTGISSFGFGKSAPGKTRPVVYLYGNVNNMGTGVYRSDNLASTTGDGASATWVKIDSDTPAIPSSIWDGVDGDMDTFGRVYIATDGRGVFYGDTLASRGSLSGSVSTSTATVNLTTKGKTDWIHWGDTSLNRKKTGGSKISTYSLVDQNGAYDINLSNPYYRALSWTDGLPTTQSTSNYNALYSYGGFSFTAPADTTTRTLVIYCGGWNSTGTLVAHLSDGSAVDYTSTLTDPNVYFGNYTVTYKAASAGQILRITWVRTGGNGYVDLSGAALY